MISPIAVYLTKKGELVTEDNPEQAFLLVGAGCFIEDALAVKHNLGTFLERALAPKEASPKTPVKVVGVVDLTGKVHDVELNGKELDIPAVQKRK